jgi:hypothetical protein
VHLKPLTNLWQLMLLETKVTDKGLKQLESLNLVALGLSPKQITATGLGHLKKMTGLQHLAISGKESPDAALARIAELKDLTGLSLPGSKVTDAGLQHLEGLANLERLDLQFTQVTDAGLEHLSGLTDPKRLLLRQTAVTDGGLEHLKTLTKLEQLGLQETKVTDEGVARLQKVLPDLNIERQVASNNHRRIKRIGSYAEHGRAHSWHDSRKRTEERRATFSRMTASQLAARISCGAGRMDFTYQKRKAGPVNCIRLFGNRNPTMSPCPPADSYFRSRGQAQWRSP